MAYRRTPAVQERLDALRTTLIDSALGLIARHGYAGCSISAVAAEAGVGTGTVYRHFANKGELFAEVFRIVCSREVSAAVQAGNSAQSTEGRYVAAVSASVHTFAERALRAPTLAYALLVEPVDPQVDTERLLFRESFRDALAVAIAAAVEAGEIPDQDASVTAACIVGAIGEALILPLARGAGDSAIIPALLTFTLRSLGSPT
ncbi:MULTISPECIES: TetR/AcrR family transcriptional regulator [Rhodococcus]|jgi:AcrR family transcriptional regulator|uniref:TetR/AcrR family transcriptional regulator n=1 Tax=Rhodococcus oxybenzonivorans TaxID=1990687 RepID=A0AAE5A8K8_9NOCA|nr:MULTISPECIES: TetR/AcrR family transcriptional regulator [Rhodococcus]MDV7242838.1 TetR/AcrR family transcriptional regulator [Rhodococcus oxybenzonivorans]MDV7267832.1 TetR/AcrR family transcriptional regulator [Rhodococcus oxybenzonivorans]MDV7275242.1 TetR/AcrR family transcriptional regulator [Rhodococcus oxybenzonivorans]MDV7334903.1 TetR/AcrR family transcriptional regulator [Rhodococcus oxybenzonivorans]MDV7345057.1 TetR/AcrR family transcriptional regulator [Rhodococcus oxybenzonivo